MSQQKTGGIHAKRIKADNIVDGVQVQGGDAEIAKAAMELAKELQTGGIRAEEIIAKNLVEGFQYIGKDGNPPDIAQFRQELAALQKQLTQAIQSGEFEDAYDAEDAQKALDRAAEQANQDTPVAEKVIAQLDKAAKIIAKVGEAAQSAGKAGLILIKLAPIAAGLKKIAEILF